MSHDERGERVKIEGCHMILTNFYNENARISIRGKHFCESLVGVNGLQNRSSVIQFLLLCLSILLYQIFILDTAKFMISIIKQENQQKQLSMLKLFGTVLPTSRQTVYLVSEFYDVHEVRRAWYNVNKFFYFSYGYSDPDYLRRVQEELAAKGITE